jgi:hypothetical protein
MALQFNCPKCGQKLTLTSSKPGDWLDCPKCEVAIQIPGAPTKPARPATPVHRPAPQVESEPPNSLADVAPQTRKPSLWADKRVQFAAFAGVVGVLLIGLFVLVLALRESKTPETAHNDPPAEQPAPPTPLVSPSPAVTPPAPVKPKDDTSPPKPKDDTPPAPKEEPPKPVTPLPPKPDYSKLDQHGNPVDQNTGLAQRNEFKGQRILFWCAYIGGGGEDPQKLFGPDNPLWKALADKGFTVRRKFDRFDTDWLKDADQCWIVSGSSPSGVNLNGDSVAAIEKFVDAGKGLCLLADNDPFTAEANQLAQHLFGVRIRGNSPATKIAYVRRPQLTPEDIKKYKGDYEVVDHPLLAGVNFVYEGITISSIAKSDKLEVALNGSDGKPVVSLSKSPKRRVVIDCGFTRYYHSPDPGLNFIEKTAGTTRLAQNMAAYLAGKDAPKKE